MKAISVKEYCEKVGKKEPAIRKQIRNGKQLLGVARYEKIGRDWILYIVEK
jgi:hypothetical protein